MTDVRILLVAEFDKIPQAVVAREDAMRRYGRRGTSRQVCTVQHAQ